MKGLSAIVVLVVIILWIVGFAYIAGPVLATTNVTTVTSPTTTTETMTAGIILPTPPMGSVPPAFLGVLLFLLGIVFVVLWAGWSPENATPEESKPSPIKE